VGKPDRQAEVSKIGLATPGQQDHPDRMVSGLISSSVKLQAASGAERSFPADWFGGQAPSLGDAELLSELASSAARIERTGRRDLEADQVSPSFALSPSGSHEWVAKGERLSPGPICLPSIDSLNGRPTEESANTNVLRRDGGDSQERTSAEHTSVLST
jgi:hypothetical protein